MTSLFSGADISGRDDLFTRSIATVLDKAKDTLASAVTVFAIAAVSFTATSVTLAKSTAAVKEVPLEIRDDALERVRSVVSDGTQPNEAARTQAATVIDTLRHHGLDAHRIVADPDGGVAVYVFGGARLQSGARPRYARFLSTNEGDVIAMCVDGGTGEQSIWETDVEALEPSMSRVRSFVLG